LKVGDPAPAPDARRTGRFARSPDVDASPVGDRVVLYHRTIRSALVLNPMATWVWSLLGTPRTSAELVGTIRARFPDVAEDRAGADLAVLLDDLLRQAFIQRDS
jgi:hypothetical protein